MFEFLFGAKKRCDRRRKNCKPKKRYNVQGSPCNRIKRKQCSETNYCDYVKHRGCRRSKFFNNLYPGIGGPSSVPAPAPSNQLSSFFLPRLGGPSAEPSNQPGSYFLPRLGGPSAEPSNQPGSYFLPRLGGPSAEPAPGPVAQAEDEAVYSNEYTPEQIAEARDVLGVSSISTRSEISRAYRQLFRNLNFNVGTPEERAEKERSAAILNNARDILMEVTTLNFGKRRRRRSTRRKGCKSKGPTKKLPSKIRKMCKRLKIKTTKKVGRRRVCKSIATLMKQIKRKLKKMKKTHRRR
jgi:hypothetical protein